MRNRLVQGLLVGTLVWGAVATLSAQETDLRAVVTDLEGKVEVKDPGSDWKPAQVGMEVLRGSILSTGFKSTATLRLGEDTVSVKPVTRLSLEELVKTGGGTRTKLFLTVGRVKAEVNPSKNAHVEFSIKSATATASVRGTGFETDGVNLVVTHGVVDLRNNWGSFHKVGSGEFARVQSDNTVTTPVAVVPNAGLQHLDDVLAQAVVAQKVASPGSAVSGVLPVPAATQSGPVGGHLTVVAQ